MLNGLIIMTVLMVGIGGSLFYALLPAMKENEMFKGLITAMYIFLALLLVLLWCAYFLGVK